VSITQQLDGITDELRRMSLQSALIGFLLSKMLPTPLSPQEIIVVQTTAVATGTVGHNFHVLHRSPSHPFADAAGSRFCWNFACTRSPRRRKGWEPTDSSFLVGCGRMVVFNRIFWSILVTSH
jgi:hypothetical protein